MYIRFIDLFHFRAKGTAVYIDTVVYKRYLFVLFSLFRYRFDGFANCLMNTYLRYLLREELGEASKKANMRQGKQSSRID